MSRVAFCAGCGSQIRLENDQWVNTYAVNILRMKPADTIFCAAPIAGTRKHYPEVEF